MVDNITDLTVSVQTWTYPSLGLGVAVIENPISGGVNLVTEEVGDGS